MSDINSDGTLPNKPTGIDRFRTTAFNVVAVLLCVFVLVGANSTLFSEHANIAMFGMLGLVLIFLSRPLTKFVEGWTLFKIIDLLLVVATVVVFGYVFVQTEPLLEQFWIDGTVLGDRAGNEKPMDFAIAIVGLVLVIEATRRAIGWTLPILCAIFIVYAFYGPDLPDWAFSHRGYTWQQIAQKTFLQFGGIIGVALKVMFLYVFLFVLFGTLLEQTGATGYVIRFARSLFRKSSGGPAKVAVISSGMMGSLSGSAVANTATTGAFTIPLMKSTGFDSETAAGVEAAASSGGALMPPIMGAGAYMMLELIEPAVTYVEIMRAALIPAILYYAALLLTVHFHSKRIGAGSESDVGTQTAEVPDSLEGPPSPWQGMVFFGGFVVLIVMLVMRYTAFRAVSVSLIGIVLLSLFSSTTRLNPRKVFNAMVAATKSGTALIVAAGCVGIILGIVSQTGLGGKLPATIQSLANDNAIIALLMLMVSTIILGMGLPSAVCYLLMATLIGGVLTSLNTPPIAAHLFIFYFGMMSMVTPPVALAAYAAAAIAKGHIIKSAFAAFRFSLVGFALPFAFVLRPELLMLTPNNEPAAWYMVVGHVGVTLLGITGLSSAIAGYAFGRFGIGTRSLLLIASLLVFFTRWQGTELMVHVAGAVLIAVLLGLNFAKREPLAAV